MRFVYFLTLFLFCPLFVYADVPVIKPEKLQPGDVIAIIAPASPPKDDQRYITECVELLKKKGYKVLLSSTVTPRKGYLAGTDAERANEFMRYWLDPTVKAIWCYRGGYGCMRILDLIDYEKIEKHPKILIGMSDITALHLAIVKKTGLVTFLGPAARHILGKGMQDPYSEKQLWEMVAPKWTGYKRYVYAYPTAKSVEYPAPKTIRPGNAQGRLIGGNLTLVTSLIGTEWQIETIGKILVLEDVGEPIYRVDRMLQQLKHAGLLHKPAAVLLCSWAEEFEQLFKDCFQDAAYPVLSGFPSGHITHQVTLPMNALAELDADKKTLQLLECPVVE